MWSTKQINDSVMPKILSMKIGSLQFLKVIVVIAAMTAYTTTFGGQNVAIEPSAVGYTVGGAVTGLLSGSSVELQNNGSNNLTVDANGPFTFSNLLPDGGSYNVTVSIQPAITDLICSVAQGSGTIDGANITDVLVDCVVVYNPNCPGGRGDEDIFISDYYYDSGGEIDCAGENSITLGPTAGVVAGTTLNLRSSTVSLNGEVTVQLGSQLHVFVHLPDFPVPAPSPLRLNDTGIVNCGDDGYNEWFCPVATHPGQDAEYGRDVTHYDNSDGHAGFNFTKLDDRGNPLPASATNWSCVKDNVTGLIWEVKTDDGGLQDKDWSYSWYNPDNNTNGGYAGWENGGYCPGGGCNTYAYVQAVSVLGLCGASNWRMPTIKELVNITSLDRFSPSIDTDYFPMTVDNLYWSSSPEAGGGDYFPNFAWSLDFEDGDNNGTYKPEGNKVRLVRGRQ